jgi:LPXTG-motif cell wall-anchored protein
VDVSTGDVWASQEANGGDVNDSGNVSVSDDVTQAAWAGNDVSQNSSSQGDKGREGNRRGGNDSDNAAFSFNDNETTVDTGDIKGGNGGWNSLDVNTGYEGSGYYGYLPSSLDITTGDVWVSQEANGGDVNGSGNVSVGSGAQCGCEKAAPKPGATAGTPATPAAPAAVKAAATKKKSTVMSSAQPTGTLAKTGADTEAPLAAGLLALGAGAALTLAGRRRREVDAA